jgi:hypothetical protein
MLAKFTTISGSILLNTDYIDAVTEPFENDLDGSLLWCSKQGLPDAGYAMDEALIWVEESMDEILILLAGRG